MVRFVRSTRSYITFLVLVLACNALAVRALARQIKLTPEQRARAHGTLPLTSFYDTPSPLAAGQPGNLIRSQPFDDYDLPDGVTAVRILYHSRSSTGEDVASSGVVLIPRGPAPKGGWPVIAWAHPFIAVARPCAPSLMRALGSGSALSMYVNLGYALIATDYTGLGTAFRNAAFDMQSNATDVVNSVIAAHKAVAQLGTRWIAIGQDDGGTAALALAENERSDSGYLGSVSISGDLDLSASMRKSGEGAWQDRLAYFAYGAQTVNPEFRPEMMFTPKGLARYEAVTPVCSPPAMKSALTAKDGLKNGWQELKPVREFSARNMLGSKPAQAPLLIISAEDTKSSDDVQVVSRMCAQKDHIEFMTYPGVGPNELIGTTVATQMAWIKARFEGRVTPNTCH